MTHQIQAVDRTFPYRTFRDGVEITAIGKVVKYAASIDGVVVDEAYTYTDAELQIGLILSTRDLVPYTVAERDGTLVRVPFQAQVPDVTDGYYAAKAVAARLGTSTFLTSGMDGDRAFDQATQVFVLKAQDGVDRLRFMTDAVLFYDAAFQAYQVYTVRSDRGLGTLLGTWMVRHD